MPQSFQSLVTPFLRPTRTQFLRTALQIAAYHITIDFWMLCELKLEFLQSTSHELYILRVILTPSVTRNCEGGRANTSSIQPSFFNS